MDEILDKYTAEIKSSLTEIFGDFKHSNNAEHKIIDIKMSQLCDTVSVLAESVKSREKQIQTIEDRLNNIEIEMYGKTDLNGVQISKGVIDDISELAKYRLFYKNPFKLSVGFITIIVIIVEYSKVHLQKMIELLVKIK